MALLNLGYRTILATRYQNKRWHPKFSLKLKHYTVILVLYG